MLTTVNKLMCGLSEFKKYHVGWLSDG